MNQYILAKINLTPTKQICFKCIYSKTSKKSVEKRGWVSTLLRPPLQFINLKLELADVVTDTSSLHHISFATVPDKSPCDSE